MIYINDSCDIKGLAGYKDCCELVEEALELSRRIRGELVGSIALNDNERNLYRLIINLEKLLYLLVRIEENEYCCFLCRRDIDIRIAVQGTRTVLESVRFVSNNEDGYNDDAILAEALSNYCEFVASTIASLNLECSNYYAEKEEYRYNSLYDILYPPRYLYGDVDNNPCDIEEYCIILADAIGRAESSVRIIDTIFGNIENQRENGRMMSGDLRELLIDNYATIRDQTQFILSQIEDSSTKCPLVYVKARLITVYTEAAFLVSALRTADGNMDPCVLLDLLTIFYTRAKVLEDTLKEIFKAMGCQSCNSRVYKYGGWS